MQKFFTILKISVFSVLFMSCSTYYLSSYYEDDGIYVSTDRGTNYEGVFDNYAQVSLDDFTSSDNGNLPWGAKPDSREIVNNFFPSFGRFYYNPFFYDSYRFGRGYPFYPSPIDYYLNPNSYFIGNYYWYYFRNSRMYPWYYGGMYDSRVYERSYANTSDPQIINQTPTISKSASRRGEKVSSSENSRSTNSNGVRVSSIYSRLGSYGGVYIDRTGINNDRMNTPNLRQLRQNNLIGVYRSGSAYSRSTNSTSSIPNLSEIKNDVVRKTYQRIRSINPSQRGSTFQGRSFNNDSGRFQASPNYFNSNSRRSSGNSSYSSSRSSGGSNFSSGSSSTGGGGGSRASAGRSRGGGGKIQ